jgi:SAM-dependent methyltransferase
MKTGNRRILDVLSAPGGAELDILPTETTMHDIKKGVLVCPDTGELVGTIENFKADFVNFNKDADIDGIRRRLKSGELPLSNDYEFQLEVVKNDNARVGYKGDWNPVENGFKINDGDGYARAFIEAECSDFSVSMLCHSWGGKALIRVDSRFEKEFDLFSAEWEVRQCSIDEHLPFRRHSIEVIPLGIKNDISSGSQVAIGDFSLTTNTKMPRHYRRQTANRANPYPDRFLDLMASVPPDGLILDCGGGNRQVGDDRYINFEYLKYELADVYGDGHALPFKNDSFDLILSQAVMEHMRDPFGAAAEIRRVLKPGGILYAEAAFMQPLHAVPYHFFNATAWGIEELFKDFEKRESGSFGDLSFTLDWMIRSAGIVDSMGEEEYAGLFKTLKKLDGHVDKSRAGSVASAVFFHGIKPRGYGMA